VGDILQHADRIRG